MDLSYVKKIIKLVEHSSIDELELVEECAKIRVALHRNSNNTPLPAGSAPVLMHQEIQTPLYQHVEPVKISPEQAQLEKKYHEIRSPIVGTFYRAPAPDADPYVEIGQVVKTGSVLCIVEAMKLMNEIESDCDGTITKILVENGKPVEYNQILFLVEKI